MNINHIPNKFDLVWDYLRQQDEFLEFVVNKYPNIFYTDISPGSYVQTAYGLGVIKEFVDDSND